MSEQKTSALVFYEVSERYVEYLKRFEDKVPNIRYETREKFVCGILFNVNGNDYYAPISSFNKPQRTNYIIKIGEYPVGSIRFSFMFPVPKSEVQRKDFSKENQHYKNLINFEYRFCKKHYNAILKKAKEVYKRTLNQIPTYEMNCCDFKLLENKCKEWEKEKMKEKDREIYYVSERLGIGDFLDYRQSLDRLEMGVSLGMEAFIDKDGKFYSQYDLEETFKNVSLDEEYEFAEQKGIKKCFIEIKDVEDCHFFQSKYVSNCIINPSLMDLNTSRKLNRTIEVLTDPLYCFNNEKCSQIKKELIEAKPLNALKLDSFTKKYIDDKALETLKIVVNNPKVYEGIVDEIDWSYTEKLNLKNRENEIIWGSELEGADDYAKDLEVAQETSRDIDKADIPNNTPEERSSVKNEIKKAKLIKEERNKAETKVVKIAKKEIEK